MKYPVYDFYTYGINKDNCITAFNKISGVSITSFKEIEEFQDTKGVIRIRISEKNRQHYDQKKKYKNANNELQNTKIE